MIRFLSNVNKSKLRGTALVRLDFNTDDEWRMQRSLPTLRLLLKHADRIVIVSHRGRPTHVDTKLSLRSKVRDLKKLLRRPVLFVPHFRFADIKKLIERSPNGSVLLLENIRFVKGEATKNPELAKKLASLADYFVNDAFAVSHRAADSVARVERFLPSYAGLKLERELCELGKVMRNPKKPLVVAIGGSKAHDKLGIIRYFAKHGATFLMGGAAANTMLALSGFDIKKSVADTDPKDRRDLQQFVGNSNIILPLDCRVRGNRILDIGPKTAKLFAERIRNARTIIWSGPLGMIETRPFDQGSLAVAHAIAANRRAFSVTGGGETVAFLKKHRLDKKFSFISTGGGAMLDFLAGEKLPGIEALKR